MSGGVQESGCIRLCFGVDHLLWLAPFRADSQLEQTGNNKPIQFWIIPLLFFLFTVDWVFVELYFP